LALPKHIYTFTPTLIHLSEYLYELYHFYQLDPRILTIFNSVYYDEVMTTGLSEIRNLKR